MNRYPRINSVVPLSKKRLLIVFRHGVRKIYDCKLLLTLEPFDLLQDDVLFKKVKVDLGGYGVSWNDEIDLSESELWLHGKIVEKVGPLAQNGQLKMNPQELVFALG